MTNQYLIEVPLGDPEVTEALIQYSFPELESIFRTIKYTNLKPLSDSQAIAFIGTLVDISEDLEREDGFHAAINMSNNILSNRDLSDSHEAMVYYCMAGSYSGLWQMHINHHPVIWDDDNLTKAIYYYRRAMTPEFIDDLHPTHAARVFTNYANTLSTVGRIVEAIEQWGNALDQDSAHAMARGNQGMGYWKYGSMLVDPIYKSAVLSYAYFDLTIANFFLKRRDATETFKGLIDDIRTYFSESLFDPNLKFQSIPLGPPPEEEYRSWCLENRSFINPLNDLGKYSAGPVIRSHLISRRIREINKCHFMAFSIR